MVGKACSRITIAYIYSISNCDLVVAWTFLDGKSREVFREIVSTDDDVWARAKGWAIWKELVTIVKYLGVNQNEVQKSKNILNKVLNDFKELG